MKAYTGRYPLFDPARIAAYPLSERTSRAEVDDFLDPVEVTSGPQVVPTTPWFRDGIGAGEGGSDQLVGLDELARYTVGCAAAGRPVIALCGAHPVKNGLGPLLIDLMVRGVISCFGGNGACTIHSFEFALTGASSESVPTSLPTGRFGMAFETGAYLNMAVEIGAGIGIGFGESMGRLYCDAGFRAQVLDTVFARHPSDPRYLKPYEGFPHADTCLYARGYECGVPTCVHASIGTDIVDQHPGFDGASKGLASAYDFLILANEMSRCGDGGVLLNIGSAVMGPEVALKAASMAANVGRAPSGLWTADFDLRPFGYAATSESDPAYYHRDQKSIAARIPQSFGGRGYYFEGSHRDTVVAFYQRVIAHLEGTIR